MIALAPFLMVVSVNEYFKPAKPFLIHLSGSGRVEAYNPESCEEEYCTWICHNKGCGKEYVCVHQTKNRINSGIIEDMYYAILKANGLDGEANEAYRITTLITLVFLIPLFMLILVALNIRLYFKIKRAQHGN